LEETKNELRTQGKLSCGARALNELTQHQLITATLQQLSNRKENRINSLLTG
jgi:hypothetical protein